MIGAKEAAQLNKLADRAAARLCRHADACRLERADIRQDLLLDLLSRLPLFDHQRSSFRSFVAMCFQHRSVRLLRAARRERAAKHPTDLDAPAVEGGSVCVVDTLGESEGFGAWIGQPTDRLVELERRLDLDRALSALPDTVLPFCVIMLGRGIARSGTPLARTTLHRRKHDLRCWLMAVGVDGERETSRVVGE